MISGSANWNDERIALLKALWAGGLSASRVAAQLGGVTRNGVIGKVHRLGLSRAGKSFAQPSKKRPNCFAGVNARRRVAKADRERVLAEKLPAEPPPPPDVKRVALLELQSGMCRWPLGDPRDPGFSFCGCEVRPRRPGEEDTGPLPYCAYHDRIAHETDTERSRRQLRGIVEARKRENVHGSAVHSFRRISA
jgi:GcrA cell cycle regulator